MVKGWTQTDRPQNKEIDAQKECKTRHEGAVKMILRELCKKLKFHHIGKGYMHKPEWILENEMHKILWKIQTDWKTRLRIIKQNKRTYHLVGLSIPTDHWVKIKESKKVDKYLDFVRELKKLWNMKVTVIPIVVGALGMVPKGLEKSLEKELRPSRP